MSLVSHPKIKTLEPAIAQREAWREQGMAVSFTNGCFDLLHAGHVATIAFSRAQADKLILGLSSDISVALNKGDKRPIMPERDRAAILAAFETVDLVVLYDEKEVAPVIEALVPDVLVKGGDTANVVGREVVEQAGGKVVLAPEIPFLSTSDVIERILERYR